MMFKAAALVSGFMALAVCAIPVSEFDANVTKGLRLVSTSADKEPEWVTEDFKLDLIRAKLGFVRQSLILEEASSSG